MLLEKICKHILYCSEELKAAMHDFTKIARAASKSPDTLWKTLSSYDAPRVLSDTLLAIVAAVFLDSNWSNCKQWFTDYIFDRDVLDKYIFNASMVMPNGGPTSSGDPVTHLKKLAAETGLPLALRRLHAPACGITSAGPNVKDAMTAALKQTAMDPSRGRAFCPMALAPIPKKSVESDEQRKRAWDHQEQVAFGLRDFNYCTLWVGGHRVGPVVGSVSPRSALRRCANLALGGGGDLQTQEALHVASETLAKATTMESASDDLRQNLLRIKALESASRPPDTCAPAEEEESGAVEAEQVVVRCPAGTWPMLLSSATANELADESDDQDEHMDASEAMPERM